jgi:hypothetical protein
LRAAGGTGGQHVGSNRVFWGHKDLIKHTDSDWWPCYRGPA